jgi:hypothetical protein
MQDPCATDSRADWRLPDVREKDVCASNQPGSAARCRFGVLSLLEKVGRKVLVDGCLVHFLEYTAASLTLCRH